MKVTVKYFLFNIKTHLMSFSKLQMKPQRKKKNSIKMLEFTILPTHFHLLIKVYSHPKKTFLLKKLFQRENECFHLLSCAHKFLLSGTKYEYTVKSQVLTCLVYKHMQAFSDCLWRGFSVLTYCDLLTKHGFFNY